MNQKLLPITLCSVVIAVPLLLAGGSSVAQSYPQKPIRVIVSFPPGGGNDALMRIIAPPLGEALGQSMVVDNRPGAGGNIAAEITAKSAPDGYTLLMGFSPVLTVNKSLYKKVPFDPIRDFSPITQLAVAEYMLVVHPSLPVKTVSDLVALAKSKPGSLNYASAGIGTPLHLAAELFKRRAGINIVHVAYKGGGPASVALLGGEVQMMFSSMTSAMPHVRSGQLRPLAVTGLKRSWLAPEIPTLNESGFPGFNVTAWGSLIAPAGTPRNIIEQLNSQTIKVLHMPHVRQLIHNIGYDPTGTTPEELAEMIQTESATWAKVIKDAHIRAE